MQAKSRFSDNPLAFAGLWERPERNAKLAASMRGKPMPAHVKAMLLKLRLGSRHSRATRKKMSATHKRLGSLPPCGRLWTPQEEALLGTSFDRMVAVALGRTWSAVATRREKLGIPSYRLGRLLRRGRKRKRAG
jgi:hypothetical protein